MQCTGIRILVEHRGIYPTAFCPWGGIASTLTPPYENGVNIASGATANLVA